MVAEARHLGSWMALMTIRAASKPVTVELTHDVLDALDAWIADQAERPLSAPI